jgi:hypothetical protein
MRLYLFKFSHGKVSKINIRLENNPSTSEYLKGSRSYVDLDYRGMGRRLAC